MANSWVQVSTDSQFPIENLPYGSFSYQERSPNIGVAIGDWVLDLSELSRIGLLDNSDGALSMPTLNGVFQRGKEAWSELRTRLTELLTDASYQREASQALLPLSHVRMHLPFEIGDYVDFYSFRSHAENLGRILRPNSEALPPNWKHLPIGYHGRSGTVRISGTPVERPWGQRINEGSLEPTFGPSEKLDIEAEVGFVVGKGTDLGHSLSPSEFDEYVFGAVLVNDWSARDLQAWEYVPLGPFLAKSFITSISPWVVTLEALRRSRTSPPLQDPKPLEYLYDSSPWALDIKLEISINGQVVSRPTFADMYWTPGQQLAHLTSNGASVRPGDLFASGTVSGFEPDQWGSLMELTWNGSRPLRLGENSERRFLLDGDYVRITASAMGQDGTRLGFGEVTGTVTAGKEN